MDAVILQESGTGGLQARWQKATRWMEDGEGGHKWTPHKGAETHTWVPEQQGGCKPQHLTPLSFCFFIYKMKE